MLRSFAAVLTLGLVVSTASAQDGILRVRERPWTMPGGTFATPWTLKLREGKLRPRIGKCSAA